MLQLNNVDKTKLSKPVLDFLNAFELKHAKVSYCLTVSAHQSVSREEHWQLRFNDTRFLDDDSIEPVGVVEWTYGKRSDHEYKVSSRKIQNDRFGHWGNEHSSQRSKDVKKALKIALDNIQPWEWHEISAKGRRDAERAHEKWSSEDSKSMYPFRIDLGIVYEEIKHLVEMGVQFKTNEFKKAAAGIEEYEEFLRKAAVKAKFDTVIVRSGKTIFIPAGRCLEWKELDGFDSLPEDTRNRISLLKLVDKNNLLPEIGFRAGENTYFILV
jgi:hypothetical protein